MHPSIRLPKSGRCPICGMELVLVTASVPVPLPKETSTESVKLGSVSIKNDVKTALSPPPVVQQIYIPPPRQQAMGLTYGEAAVRSLFRQARAPLRLEPDPAGLREISIKAGGGFVISVDIGFPGQEVHKGQRLFTVLSEGWIEAQQDYIRSVRALNRTPLENKNANLNSLQTVLNRYRQRIRLWDLSEEQIQDLEKIANEASEWDVNLARRMKNNLEIRSPMDGYVLEKNIVVGMRYDSGQKLLLLAPRSPLWGVAAFTPEDAARIQPGDQVKFTIDTLSGEELIAPVDHVDPSTDPQTRRVNVHLKITDALAQLRPGQTGAVTLDLPPVSVLSVPTSALLPLGRDSVVFVDRGSGNLEPRRVRSGERFGDMIEIKGGLQAGETVATSANFLLDSEARLKGALPTSIQENP